jgi:choline-sulfatase
MRWLVRLPVPRTISLGLVILFSALYASAGTPRKAKAPVNVVLITIDTVRADHLGCYGFKNIQTPTIDGLARDGVVFERAISQVPLTWPSHAVILTGTYPFQNGVQDFTGQPLSPQFRSVAQAFKQHGYATGAVVSAFVLDRSWGLARGIDFYDDTFSSDAFLNKDIGLVDRRADESVSHAISWLKKTQRPFFFWLHLYDPHSPYNPPEPFHTEYARHPYDGEIAYTDHELGRLIAWLRAAGIYDRTAIVLLSDHGESLGEHGEDEHGFFVYNATVHIPLIVKPPAGSGFQPAHVSRPVETTSVAPTLLRLAGLKDKIQTQFNSAGLLGKAAEGNGAYSETLYPLNSFGWSPLHGLETGRYHYIEAPTPELYDLSVDPGETNNVAGQQPAVVATLKRELQDLQKKRPFQSPQGKTPGLSPDAADKLRSLGYVGYRSPVSAEALTHGLADPKDKVGEFNSILRAQDALRAGDYAGGEKLLNDVREKDPKMYIAPFYLAEAAMRQNHWEDAAREFKNTLELNPNFDQAMTGLAHAVFMQGNRDEARRWIEKALEYNPENYRAWYELGSIETKVNPAQAAADFGKAVNIQPNFAPLRRDFGVLEYEQKNYAEGARHLVKAVELGVNEAPIFNFLGICYSQTGRITKAIESYRQALLIDPNLAQAHLNLGYAYQQTGHAKEAETEYDLACKLQEKFCKFVPQSKSKSQGAAKD